MLSYERALLGAASAGGQPIYVEDVFSTWLYTGNGTTQTITNGIDLTGEGGMVWIKNRDANGSNNLVSDTERGNNATIRTNTTESQTVFSSSFGIQHGSSGFTVQGENNTADGRNNNGYNHASWTFRKAKKFFDVVTYTGNSSNRTIAHNLGSVPGCIIVKRTDSSENWVVYHRGLANPDKDFLTLNSSAASDVTTYNRWGTSGNVSMTSTHFSVGTADSTNVSNGTFVAYLFAHDAGGFGDDGAESVIKCGETALDANGFATVSLGYEPQFVMIKSTEYGGDWAIYDTMRGAGALKSSNLYSAFSAKRLKPNSNQAESTVTDYTIAPSSTGFTLSATGYAGAAFDNFIYIAIRRGPMKTPEDATTVFDADLQTGGGFVTTDFPVDLSINTRPGSATSNYVVDRLRDGVILNTTSTAAEGASSLAKFDYQTGFEDDNWSIAQPSVYWSFRRAPGFFDVVAYTGNGSGSDRNITHNLQVKPEMVIIKCRNEAQPWATWHKGITGTGLYGTNYNVYLNLTNASSLGQDFSVSGNTDFTSTTFTVVNAGATNTNTFTYIAYLFATCPGVSKVGSYTGTGTTLSVDCGFTAGARFVLIKRTDSTGDWYVWDTARGIVSGNDPYLRLNATASQNTGTDFIDPLSTGFQISSSAPAAINALNGEYIFLAIA